MKIPKIVLMQYGSPLRLCDWDWANRLVEKYPNVREEFEKSLETI